MPTLFRLLDLPLLVQKIIIPQIDFTDSIELTMMSPKFKKILQLLKISIDKLEFIFTEDSNGLRIFVNKQHLFIKVNRLGFDFPNCKIDGAKMNINESKKLSSGGKNMTISYSKARNDEEALEKVANHVLSFSKIQSYDLTVSKMIDFDNIFVWKKTRKFDKIWYLQSFYYGVPLRISSEHLKFLFHQVETKFLSLDVETKYNAKYQIRPGFEYRHQELRATEWLDIDSAMNLDIETISCKSSKRSEHILQQWVKGNHKKLGNFTLRPGSDRDRIMKLLNSQESTITRLQLGAFGVHNSGRFDMNDGFFDIKRECDGQLATVAFNRIEIQLIVWNEKNLKKIGR